MKQAFEHEQRAKHVVIRRTISSLADGFSFRVNASTEDEQLGWSQYVTLTLNLLEVYQTQQAQFVFPAARNITRNPRLLAVEESEHQMLHSMTRWWDAVRQSSSGEGVARLTQQLVSDTKQKFAALQGMMCSRGGHLEREAKVLTANFWRASSVTEWDLKNINDAMHRVNPSIKRGPALAFFVMNLNDEVSYGLVISS